MTALQVGDELAGYRIIELVGTGGMGRVYRAVHPVLQRIVALKVIRPEIASDVAARAGFRRQVRLIASIDHASIVPVYDVAEEDGVQFIAMRWAAGSDLRHLLAEEGALQPTRAVHVLAEIAAALSAGHQLGVVHGDIKPTNVFLEGDRAFLSDFGLTSLLVDGEAATIAQGWLGTLDYAAPEILDGELPTPQTDVYALGCVLYEMLTGCVPRRIEAVPGTLDVHACPDPLAPSQRRPDLPPSLDDVVQRCLAVDPAERFATPHQVGIAAAQALPTPPARRQPRVGGRRRRRRLLLAAGVLLAGACALALLIGLSSGSPPPYATGGRRLSAPATLPKCVDGLAGPPRTCRNAADGDGLLEIGDPGRIVRMSTMDVDVTGVKLVSALPVASTGGEVTAPSGKRFIVIDLTVTNVTRSPQEFEPNETANGRLTVLLLFGASGSALSNDGPGGADYSAQYLFTRGVVPHRLYRAALPPGRPVRGQLVFYYPKSELRRAKDALLVIKELGEPLGSLRSQALVRLRL